MRLPAVHLLGDRENNHILVRCKKKGFSRHSQETNTVLHTFHF